MRRDYLPFPGTVYLARRRSCRELRALAEHEVEGYQMAAQAFQYAPIYLIVSFLILRPAPRSNVLGFSRTNNCPGATITGNFYSTITPNVALMQQSYESHKDKRFRRD